MPASAKLMPASSVKASGDTSHASSHISLSAAEYTARSTLGHDVIFSFKAQKGFTYKVTLTPAATFDAALYAFSDPKDPEGSCLAGSDVPGKGKKEIITVVLKATGTLYLGVDSHEAKQMGAFTLSIELLSTKVPDAGVDGPLPDKATTPTTCSCARRRPTSCARVSPNNSGYFGTVRRCRKPSQR